MIEQARDNIRVLQQGARLLRRLDDRTYRYEVDITMVSSVGVHMRHNLDHYANFFVGLESGAVDYDARERRALLEVDRDAALDAIQSICRRLANLAEFPRVTCLRICCDSDRGALRTSSVARELDYLYSHTIHHYAIIAVLCRLQNVVVEQDFGVAPSTLRYQALSNAFVARG